MTSKKTIWEPLPGAEVKKAINRQKPSRIPMVRAKWWGEGLEEQYGSRLSEFDCYPEDVQDLWLEPPIDYLKMGLSWELPPEEGAHDSRPILDDWAKLDEFIEKLPDPQADQRFDDLIKQAETARNADRYILFGWWRLFFERPWQIRGMSDLLMDYYVNPEEIHKLYDALCKVYEGYIQRAIRELQPDGFWTSDDLGHQAQPFMRPKTFHEFLFPYYVRVGQVLKLNGVHWWLHSCGNNTPLLDDLIEAGVTVFHPVQKGTMDEIAVAREYGDRLTFLAGFDVQHILQEASPDEVRKEVRWLIDTFDQIDGGMCIAAGNGIVSGTPFENIKAFLDEAASYGQKHREEIGGY
ncbi:uroporphyrinogen decarboxylase family protein [Chloroflexota bacterium]